MDLAREPRSTARNTRTDSTGQLGAAAFARVWGEPSGPHVFRASGEHAVPGEIEGPWHDDLLGGAWSWPGDDDEDARTTMAEFEALLGELVAELGG